MPPLLLTPLLLLLAPIPNSSTLHLRKQPQPSHIISCAGCLQAIEPWGDVLGDNPIARQSSHLKQLGNGGGDPTAPLDDKFQSTAAAIQPGPKMTTEQLNLIRKPVTTVLSKKNIAHTLTGTGVGDTLDNKCFYCVECPDIYGQKCYMLQNTYDTKYLNGVCLGLSFLWVKARNWDAFIETLSTIDGKKVIVDIMDGQEKYMAQTSFPPNYAKGLMTELYQIPAEDIEVEMVELSKANPRKTFEEFIERAIQGTDAAVVPCIVIVFSKAHAMAIRVTAADGTNDDGSATTRLHFFDPNYGQFGMTTMEDFVDRLWHFVQPPNVDQESDLPAYGSVWAYVRHVEHAGAGAGGGSGAMPVLLKSNSELGGLEKKNVVEQAAEPFVPTDASEMPLAEPDAGGAR